MNFLHSASRRWLTIIESLLYYNFIYILLYTYSRVLHVGIMHENSLSDLLCHKKIFFLEFEMIHLNSCRLLHFKAFLVDSAEFYFILLFLDPLQQILFCMSECYGHIVCEVCVCLVQCLSVWHSLHIVPFFPNFVSPNLVFLILPSLFLVLNI